MKIETIKIQNFRCFGPEPAAINLESSVTALVGGNGSGKTALLIALSRLFGVTSRQRNVIRRDFHLPPDDNELQSDSSLYIECVLGFPELGDADNAADAVPDYFMHMAASAPGDPLKVRIRLRATWTDDGTPDGTVEEDVRWVSTLDDAFDWDQCQKVSAVDRATIQLVYVPAMRNAADQVTGLLKGRLWKAAKWSQKLAKTTERGAGLIQKRFEQEEPTQFIVQRLARRWQQVHEADTDTRPVLRLLETRLEELVRRAEFAFYPDEAGQVRGLADLSDGQQSLFHIALTAATLEIERDVLALAADDSAFDQEKLRRAHLTILAIEEPENSLSPFFLSRIMSQARDIGALSSAQVVLSSHSASILGRVEPDEVRYFRLDCQTRRAAVRSLTLPEGDVEAASYVRLAVRAYPEIYFARFVVLGEGDSERIVLPRIAAAMGVPLDLSFVPVVPLGGRYVEHFWRLLNDLQIPHATLIDLDLGRVHGGANAVRTIVSALANIGNDLSDNSYVELGFVDLDDIEHLQDVALLNGFENNGWLQALKAEDVYFSDPIDIDFAMLMAFPTAYQHAHPGGRGPRDDADSVQRKNTVTLKTGGNPALYDARFDNVFTWYPYLFLSRSKPETHIAALSRIAENHLRDNAPPALRALINHIADAVGIAGGEG